MERAIKQLEKQQRKADASRRKEADDIREDLQRELHNLLGASELAELREAIDAERLAFRELWQPPAGLGQDYGKARRAVNRRLAARMRRLGVQPARLRALSAEYNERLLNLASDVRGKVTPGYHLESNLDTWMNLSPLHAYPLPWGAIPPPPDPNDRHRWFLFRPPFWGFLFSFWSDVEEFQVDRELFLDPPAGLVGNAVSIGCDDSDWARAQVRAEAQIAFGFTPPVPGILEIVVDTQCVRGTYDLTIRDNFGFSGASAAQYNYIMISLLHPSGPETQVALMDTSAATSDGDDKTLANNHLNIVQHYFAHLFSSQPVRAGESIIVTVGTRSMDFAGAHNMEFHSRSNFQWFISSVEVRIVP